MYQAGLILEGGGMKGAYSAGVLDFFLEQEIEFSSCYGVSAGAIVLCSFLSKQKKRGFRSLTEYIGNEKICGLYSLVTEGNIVSSKFAYDLVPNYLLPFDSETFDAYQGKAYAVATDVETGKAAYLPMKKTTEAFKAVQASSSLPLVSRMVSVGGRKYLDGGLADSIPIQRSILDGNKKNVVILTKEKGYVRQPANNLKLLKLRYGKYPKIYECMKERHNTYNETMDYIHRLEAEGKVFIIQAQERLGLEILDKDENKLKAAYEMGYEDAKNHFPNLTEYLKDVSDE